ncbi:MAG: hypothetical protein JWM10_2060, partial [Myxococcaceae bacterium]|nr:hypothetical protein [Myxococcaceae bacterium]
MLPLAPTDGPPPLLRGAPPGALPPTRAAVLAHGLEARHLGALVGHPGVRRLHLLDCDLDPDFLRELLASLPALDALHLAAPAL